MPRVARPASPSRQAVTDTVNVLRKHTKPDHGVIDVRGAISELETNGKEPVEAFLALLNDSDSREWHFYALEGLRSLGAAGRLDSSAGLVLLTATMRDAQSRDMDEYYRTISALAASPETAKLVVRFIIERLSKRDVRDWRWLAFYAAGMLSERVPTAITLEAAARLANAANDETDR